MNKVMDISAEDLAANAEDLVLDAIAIGLTLEEARESVFEAIVYAWEREGRPRAPTLLGHDANDVQRQAVIYLLRQENERYRDVALEFLERKGVKSGAGSGGDDPIVGGTAQGGGGDQEGKG